MTELVELTGSEALLCNTVAGSNCWPAGAGVTASQSSHVKAKAQPSSDRFLMRTGALYLVFAVQAGQKGPYGNLEMCLRRSTPQALGSIARG